MTTPERPTPAQAILALYGALDRAVTSTGDPGIEAIVERYLPGSTGANAGWYDELLGFLGRGDPEFAQGAGAPNLSEALSVLREQGDTSPAQDTSKPKAPRKTKTTQTAGVRAARPEEPARPLSTVQKSRMTYAVGALAHLPDWYLRRELGESFDEPFSRTLGVAGGPDDTELLDLLLSVFANRDAWPPAMSMARRRRLIDADVADVPLCQPKLMTVRGYPCLVLTTQLESPTVSLDAVKDVVDPLNWARCLSTFFCSMEEKPARKDGWSRVLEHVSMTCPIPKTQLVTPLKYWNGEGKDEQQRPTAWVNYALDDEPASDEKGDGLIVVDEGFIRMTSTATGSDQPGVLVRTRKVVGIRQLEFTPWGIFACTMGYGDQGIDMLLGGAKKRSAGGGDGWRDWKVSTLPAASGAPPGSDSPPATGKPAQGAPAADTDTSRRAVELAVDMLNECIDDVSEKSAAIAAKWATGAVPIAETMAFSSELAARLATDPWRYLERLRYLAQGGDK